MLDDESISTPEDGSEFLSLFFFPPLQVTVNGDVVESQLEKVTEAVADLQFEEEEEESAFYTKV